LCICSKSCMVCLWKMFKKDYLIMVKKLEILFVAQNSETKTIHMITECEKCSKRWTTLEGVFSNKIHLLLFLENELLLGEYLKNLAKYGFTASIRTTRNKISDQDTRLHLTLNNQKLVIKMLMKEQCICISVYSFILQVFNNTVLFKSWEWITRNRGWIVIVELFIEWWLRWVFFSLSTGFEPRPTGWKSSVLTTDPLPTIVPLHISV